jgi:two-component system CheB/CheR fusion protein
MIAAEQNPDEPARHRVVAIGASAGGLESLEQLFAQLPSDTGMAFVVIQHLSPDFRSVMDELIARRCEMPVHLAQDGELVEPNHVYLMPPRKEMIIQERRLILADKDPAQGLTLPIDQFFRSLAADLGPEAVAVVLSGSGSDGSRGVVDVKRAGGLVLVESPASAKFDGMPLSAQATGLVDHTAVPRDLARLLCGLPPLEPLEAEVLSDSVPLDSVLHQLRDQFGIDFSLYKTTTVERRIQRRIDLLHIASVEAYAEQLRHDPDELNALYQDLLIGVTQFFRDPAAFELLEREVIPQVLDAVPADQEIRIWCAGCATGEEPYSLAMLFHEALAARGRPVNLKILATDMHHLSLEHASAGIYGDDQLAHVSEQRLARFFTRRSSGYQISADLRQQIVFARHNVTKDAPFTKMHFIACRNMLIYLQPHAQRAVLSLFHFGLAPGGVLFLGASESPGALSDEFTVIDEHWKIYRKRRDIQLITHLRLPLSRSISAARAPRPIDLPRPTGADPLILATYDQLLDRYMPPSFLVDEERNLIDSFGGAERWLRVRRRRPSSSILDQLDGDLRTVIAGAIQRALKDGAPVRYQGVRLPGADGEQRCVMSATPLSHPRTGVRHVVISFEELSDTSSTSEPVPVEPAPSTIELDALGRQRMETLETELSYTRETLQATIEELETSNEEMQATNEELVASNEELQSTNEELHSVNEELYTVNAEYQAKILELKELNSDIHHLLEGTDVGTLFLDADLRIRRFTARIASVFRIQPHDIGRELTDFSHNIERDSLMEDIEAVMRDGAAIEDEVRDRAGTPYFLRILPYRVASPRDAANAPRPREPSPIAGVVLTLTDLTALDKARSRLAQLSAIVESSDDAIIGKTLDGVISTWNRGAQQLYGYTAEEAIGRNIAMLATPGDEKEFERVLAAIRRGDRVEHVHATRRRKDGSAVEVSLTVSAIRDRDGELVGVSGISRDITPLISAQRELEERQSQIRQLLDSTAEAIIGLDREGRCTFCNPACVRMLGYASADELVGKAILPLIHPDEDCAIARAFRDGKDVHSDDEVLRRVDGTTFPAEYWSYPIRRGDKVVGAVVTFLDITERRRAEDEIRTAARRREQFLAMLSHELRNPLAAVLNAVRMMQHDSLDAAGRERCQGVIERQARHMARLLDDLLDVSRDRRGKFELRKEDLDLRRPIEAAIESAQPRIEERDIELALSLPDQPLPVRGDHNRLQQVVVNLLHNAATYSPRGGRVELDLGRENGHAKLRVTDHGMGISPEMLDKIFDLFVQAEQPLDRSLGGLGVGLSLARTIVELHGGTIDAHSDGAGRGAELLVRLPLQPHALRDRREPTAPTRAAPCRIVLVEDQDDAREMLRMLLESMEHVVIEAADGVAGVHAIEAEHPDVALVDIGLPEMNGYEVAARVRERDDLGDVVLVALTGYGAPSDIAAARDAGFDDHLIKPVELRKIQEILARCRPS